MNIPPDPERLHVAAFAQAAGQLEGAWPVARFERLMELGAPAGGGTQVVFSAQGCMRDDPAGTAEPWIRLRGNATVQLVCQRCLGPVDTVLAFERDFRFVASEALAEVEDEESDEDVLVASTAFNLLDLLEDELLMAVPLVPKHVTCPGVVRLRAAAPGFNDEPAPRTNPFAALGALKRPGGTSTDN
jgi:uncharacterized protein